VTWFLVLTAILALFPTLLLSCVACFAFDRR
jgi:hypothetical protein